MLNSSYDLSIVIPVYNEEKNLPILAQQLQNVVGALAKKVEIIFIDDGSTDSSPVVLRQLASDYAVIKAIFFKRNFGQTGAIAAGFDHAQGDIVITMDADLQNDPADIPILLEEMNTGCDVVSGWRKHRQDNVLLRKIPSYCANKLISWYTGVHLHDYGCTLKAYRRELTKAVNLYGEMHRFIPALMSWSGAVIHEIPVCHHARKYGVSKYGISRTINVLLDLLTVKFWLSSFRGPMHIFGKLGVWLIGGGIFSGGITLLMKLTSNKDLTGNPLLYLAIFLGVVGLQFVSMGLLGEVNLRMYTTSQNKVSYSIKEIV